MANAEAPPLHEAFTQQARCYVQISSLFIDIAGSTAMQQNEPEASWVPQLGWFYEKVHLLLKDLRAEVPNPVDAKYLGDGIMVTTDSRCATELVNFGIRVQEEVNRASRRGADGSKGQIDFNVSVGVATGRAYRFTSPDGLVDYVSKTVSTARRLCDAATPRAVFIDEDTQMTCNLSYISSQYGNAEGRRVAEYIGEKAYAPLKGLNDPIGYFEVLWETSRFGVKSETATSAVERERANNVAAQRSEVAVVDPAKPQRHVGKIKSWNAEKEFGFIEADDGTDYYFNRNLLAHADDADEGIESGLRVAFMGLPPAKQGASPQAAVVLFDNVEAEGVVSSLPSSERRYGWIVVADARGTRHFVYLAASEVPEDAKRDSPVVFTVQVSSQGSSAAKVEVVEA